MQHPSYLRCLAITATCLASSTALADRWGRSGDEWGLAVPEVAINTAAGEGCPIETSDGLSLLIASTRDGGLGGLDIWAADRVAVDAPWSAPRNLGADVNSSAADFCPTPALGRSLFFVSERTPGDCGGGDIYLSRQSPARGWSTPMILGCAPNGPNFPGPERSPSLVETWYGTFLFYSSTGDTGNHDIYVSRLGADGQFGPGKIVQALSTADTDLMPNVRVTERGSFEIAFSSDRASWGRGQGAHGGQDVYTAESWWLPFFWSSPRNVGPNINTSADEQRATLSADGKRMHFGRSGDIYVSER